MKKFTLLYLMIFLISACQPKSPKISVYKPKKLIKECKNYLGTPYLYGGNGKKGIDCSGLIYNSLNSMGYSFPRVSYQQAETFKEISIKNLKKGDLIYFITSGNRINHTGVITKVKLDKEISFLHASTQKGVCTDNLYSKYWYPKFVKATRPTY